MQKAFGGWGPALVAGCLASASAAAQVSQVGGLPALADRTTTLESKAGIASGQITALQSAVASLQSANSSLTSAITGLTSGLNAERSDRLAYQQFTAAQFAGLSSAITAEKNARVAADDALRLLTGSSVATFVGTPLAQFLPNGDETVLSSLQLQAGKYLLIAKAEAGSFNRDLRWVCRLFLNGQQLLDRAEFYTVGLGLLAIRSAGYENFSLHSVTTLSGPGRVDFQCSTGEPNSFVRGIVLVGLNLGPSSTAP